MFTSNTGRLGRIAATSCGLLLAALLGCASASTPSSVPNPEVARLSDVQIEPEGSGTIVRLMGIGEPSYTAFAQDDPKRVVVDLDAVRPDGIADSMPIHDGVVDEILVTPFLSGDGEPRTRVELALSGDVEYDIVPLEDGLEIRMSRTGGEALANADPADAGMDPWADPTVAPITIESGTEAASEIAPMTSGAATKLVAVKAEPGEPGMRIHLQTDGAVAGSESFTLEDPARLVIDLPGLKSEAQAKTEVGSRHAGRVRVGQHADKVRVVIDGDEGTDFAGHQLQSEPNGVWVLLGGSAGVAAAASEDALWQTASAPAEVAADNEMAEAAGSSDAEEVATVEETTDSEDVAEPAMEETASDESSAGETEIAQTRSVDEAWAEPTSSARQVYGVQYEAQEDRDRVVIVTEGVADYKIIEPDPGTFMVSLSNAVIDPEAEVHVAPESPGVVQLVTAFQQPDVETPEVRIVIRRSDATAPELNQQGPMLLVDFDRRTVAATDEPTEMAEGEATGRDVPAEASSASGKALASNEADMLQEEVPAAIDPDSPVEILAEGGLVDGKEYVGRRISLDFKDVEIADVLRLIAEVSDLNIIAGDEVTGTVTIRLVEVPWDQALDVILLTKGLGFVRVGNVLRIAPSEILQSEEEARLQERRAREKLEDLVVKLQPVNYANVDEIGAMVKRLLTARGTVDIDKRTNTVIIKDIPTVIDEATALIKALDTQTPQVLIEAKIVEANLDFGRELGSAWAFGIQPLVDGFDDSSGDDRTRDIGDKLTFHNEQSGVLPGLQGNHVAVSNPITSLANGLLNVGAFLLDDHFNLQLQLQAAESSGEGKVISSPRVVTLDNREAIIEQGVSIPFQTFENGDAQLEFVDAVLKLVVTPHITADRAIIMEIEVQRNAPDDSVSTPTGSPAIAKNQAQTETLVRDGQTLVIGGIYVINKSDRQSRVPYLYKIPIIGSAFRSNETRDIRKELLIFVTPRIVIHPDAG